MKHILASIKQLSDRNRLLLLLFLLLSIGFFTTSLLSYVVSKNALRNNVVDQNLPLTSDTIYSETQRDLLQPISVSRQMARDTFLRDWVLSGEKDQAQIVKYLAQIKSEFGGNTTYFISEKTRNYYYAGGLLGKVREDDPEHQWYFRLKSLADQQEISVDTDKAHAHQLTIFINIKVYDYNQKFIGVTGVGINFDILQNLIKFYQEKYHRQVFFTDDKGVVTLASQHLAEDSIAQREGLNTLAEQIFNPKKQARQLSYRYQGQVIQLNTRYIPELGWYLFVEENESGFVNPLRKILWINMLISLLATLLVVWLTYLVVNYYQKRLEYMAGTDALSGLTNRATGEILLAQAIRDAERNQQSLSIVLIDLDYFKQINDTFGHLSGDKVIQKFARLLKKSLRKNDVVSRWGGEEFLVVMNHCALKQAEEWAERMRVAMQTEDYELPTSYVVTASYGVVERHGDESLKDFFARADHALYQAKAQGRNRTVAAQYSEASAKPTAQQPALDHANANPPLVIAAE